jgi:ABC-2 type transport system permease protein
MNAFYKSNLVAFNTIARRQIYRLIRLWAQNLLPTIVTTTIYFLIFGRFIGRQIGEINGVPYVYYITPGLLMMSLVMNCYQGSGFGFYLDKYYNCIEELLVAPVFSATIVWGYVVPSMIRGMVTGAFVCIIAYFLDALQLYNLFVIITMSVLTSVLFSFLGLVNAIYAKNFEHMSIIPNFILTPLTYLGGTFYSVADLPPFWRKINSFNPLLYVSNGFRYGMVGFSDVSITTTLLFLLLINVICYALVRYLLLSGNQLKR